MSSVKCQQLNVSSVKPARYICLYRICIHVSHFENIVINCTSSIFERYLFSRVWRNFHEAQPSQNSVTSEKRSAIECNSGLFFYFHSIRVNMWSHIYTRMKKKVFITPAFRYISRLRTPNAVRMNRLSNILAWHSVCVHTGKMQRKWPIFCFFAISVYRLIFCSYAQKTFSSTHPHTHTKSGH